MIIDGLHLTSRRPCWMARTMICLCARNQTLLLCKFCEKKLYCVANQNGRRVTWVQTKNKKVFKRHFEKVSSSEFGLFFSLLENNELPHIPIVLQEVKFTICRLAPKRFLFSATWETLDVEMVDGPWP